MLSKLIFITWKSFFPDHKSLILFYKIFFVFNLSYVQTFLSKGVGFGGERGFQLCIHAINNEKSQKVFPVL
jgi:hypothetical protein